MSKYQVTTYAARPDLFQQARALNPTVWPEFMLHDPVANRLWGRLHRELAAWQVMVFDETDTVLAVGNTAPLPWDGTLPGLPAGWDDAFERAVAGLEQGQPPTTLCALQATVAQSHQGQGLSAWVLRAMKWIGARNGLAALIAPVRPAHKSRYPLTPIERYVTWTRPADGAPFDPWLGVHERLGAQRLAVCAESMRIPGTLAEWEAWTALAFPESGPYIVPGALTPVTIDRERDLGLYVEPNVWMRHAVTAQDLALESALP